ncbi:MAG: alkaline phosphatase [Mucinivorans sp.]
MKKNLLLCLTFFLCMPLFAQVKGVQNVVLIGADGFGAFMLRDHADKLPNLSALMARGSSTLEMRSVLPSSSAVNWASILMGAGPELHGYTEWGSKTPDLPSRVTTSRGTFPCVMNLTRAKYPKCEIGAFYGWDGIGYLFDTVAVNVGYLSPDDDQTSAKACEYLSAKHPKLAFFYLAEPDHTGHTKGWGSTEYIDMCQKIDRHVGQIIDGIRQAGMEKNTIVIFIADHGGKGTGHGGKTMKEMQVPYIVAGPGVRGGYTIPESMMVYDNAALIAHILNLDVPQVWIGRPAMSIFAKGNL